MVEHSTPKELSAGWHFFMDGLVEAEKTEKLGDLGFVESVLWEVPDLLEIAKLSDPLICERPLDQSKVETDEDDGGVTGNVIITTGHVSIHTWPLRGRFSLDVFLCRQFDNKKLDAWLRDYFGVTRAATHWTMRNWP